MIFISTFPQHLERLKEVRTCLANAGLQLNTKKCRFARKTVKVLGHVVSKEGIQPDTGKITAVLNFPRPLQQKALRSFLGLASYFRRFIPGLATLASPLNRLLQSDVRFTWSDDCEKAFHTLKGALACRQVLCHFDETRPALLHTDASGTGIGAVLLQRDDQSRGMTMQACCLFQSLSHAHRKKLQHQRTGMPGRRLGCPEISAIFKGSPFHHCNRSSRTLLVIDFKEPYWTP